MSPAGPTAAPAPAAQESAAVKALRELTYTWRSRAMAASEIGEFEAADAGYACAKELDAALTSTQEARPDLVAVLHEIRRYLPAGPASTAHSRQIEALIDGALGGPSGAGKPPQPARSSDDWKIAAFDAVRDETLRMFTEESLKTDLRAAFPGTLYRIMRDHERHAPAKVAAPATEDAVRPALEKLFDLTRAADKVVTAGMIFTSIQPPPHPGLKEFIAAGNALSSEACAARSFLRANGIDYDARAAAPQSTPTPDADSRKE